MPVLTVKRIAFVIGISISAAVFVLGYFQRDLFLALAGISMAGAGLGLLGIAIYRRAGYLIVLSNQRAAHAEARLEALVQSQQAVEKQLRSAESGELRALVLNAFRETMERCDSIEDRASRLLEQQRQSTHAGEYLKHALGVLGHRLDRELGGLKGRFDSAVQQAGRELTALRSQVESGEQGVLRDLGGVIARLEEAGKQSRRDSGAVEQAVGSVRDALEKEAKRLADSSSAVSAELKSLASMEKKSIEAFARPFERIEKEVANLRYSVINDNSSLSSLLERCAPRAVLPEFSGWALEPKSIALLVELILQRRPQLVVECGSGVSTIWLAYALEKTGGRLVALEHLEKFADVTRVELERHGLTHVAEVRTAALEDFEIGGDTYKWYAESGWAGLEGIDVLLVDGPPKATGPLARYPALPLLETCFAADVMVVLDDIHRDEEREILARWHREFSDLGAQHSIGPRTTAVEWRTADRS